MGASILVVEDDDVAGLVTLALARHDHALDRVESGAEAIARVTQLPPDLMLLGLGLPDMAGLEVCQRVRASGYAGGILMVTPRAKHVDVAAILRTGADTFLAKPFGLAELLARVNEILRQNGRGARQKGVVTTGSGLRVDTATRLAQVDGFELRLTDREFDALALLVADMGAMVPTRTMVTCLWGEHTYQREHDLALTIRQLQRKLA